MPCPSAVSVPWVSKQCNGTKIADPSNPRGFRWRPPAATGRHCHSLALVRLWAQYRYRTVPYGYTGTAAVTLECTCTTTPSLREKEEAKKLELQL